MNFIQSFKNRYNVSSLFLVGSALIFLSILGLGFLFILNGLDSRHWLLAPGTAKSIGSSLLPYNISLIGCGWGLMVLDAIFTGQLFWGRGTGSSDRHKGPIGFWLGILFQGALALFLIGLGISVKNNPKF